MPHSTPEAFARSVHGALDAAREARDAFLALPQEHPVAAQLSAFEGIAGSLNRCRGEVGLFSSVHPNAGLRDAAEELEQELVKFQTELSLDRRIYDRLTGIELTADSPFEERRLIEHALRDYRRSGVDRDEATRERVRALREELVEIGQSFDRNIVQGTREVLFREGHAALAGLPADYLDAHPEDAEGNVLLTTDMPDMLPVMMYAENDELRRRMAREHANRAYPENLAVLDSLLAKRHELATLLGYPSWAAYATEDKMVGSPEVAAQFIARVSERARPVAEEQYAQLLEEKRRREPDAERVELHEQRYLTECVKRSAFAFDSQAVRPYFAYERVKQGVLDTAAALYGVSFRRYEEPESWHPAVESWEVVDGGEAVARFHLDMFPRSGKYKHAAMFDLVHGLQDGVLPEAVLVCNFPEPEDGNPALMLHTQVTTFFHEFGHLLHHLFGGRQRWLSFSGIATEWDFVEVPSQLFEEWAWDVQVLQTFALHHESEEPIPSELVEKLRAAEEYGKGLHVQTQMMYASISLDFYSSDPAELDTTQRVQELRREHTLFEEPEGHHFQAGFGHLHGYSAIYYTYMWSLVIAKDLWGQFEAAPMDRAVAGRYRAEVLAPGGGRDAVDLVRGFLGRDYAFEAWERWLRA